MWVNHKNSDKAYSVSLVRCIQSYWFYLFITFSANDIGYMFPDFTHDMVSFKSDENLYLFYFRVLLVWKVAKDLLAQPDLLVQLEEEDPQDLLVKLANLVSPDPVDHQALLEKKETL